MIFDNAARCPKCGEDGILVFARVPVIIKTEVGSSGLALADAWGNSFPISEKEKAVCNRSPCQWEGLLSDTKSTTEEAQ